MLKTFLGTAMALALIAGLATLTTTDALAAGQGYDVPHQTTLKTDGITAGVMIAPSAMALAAGAGLAAAPLGGAVLLGAAIPHICGPIGGYWVMNGTVGECVAPWSGKAAAAREALTK